MSKRRRDEEKREMHIERGREQRERAAYTPRKKGEQKPKKPRIRKRTSPAPKPRIRKSPKPQSSSKPNVSAKLSSIKSELNSLSFRTRNLPNTVNQLDNNISEISTRVQNIRNSGYRSQTNLDKRYDALRKTWENISPNIQSFSLEQSNELLQKQNNLEARIDRASSLDILDRYSTQLSDLSGDFIAIENSLRSQLNDYQNHYEIIDKDLRVAEETVSNLSNSSIEWKNNESPVLAVKIHDLTNDRHGILALTNLRILFEEVKEEVIRKNLFFATEKKTTREVVLDQPIGSIDLIEKGRVGFLKGAGLFLKFKPQTDLEELKIDTSGNDDDKIIHFYNYVISGEAEKELEPVKESIEDNVPVNCPNCSAPYGEEILKGQTSVKCIYCGSVIKI
jgi:chromosome segregation ATPase